MGRKPKTSRPSFFKVLIKDNYTTRLRLPHAFVRKYGKYLTENVKLRTSFGDTWNVKVDEETYDDEKYWCFVGGGWIKFVKDLELKLGEFLVFSFNVGTSITFDVSVFGTNCCEREISAMAADSNADEHSEFMNVCHNLPDVRKKRSRSCSGESEAAGIHPRFEIVFTESHKSRLRVPNLFAEATGLIAKRAVVLEHPPKQRYWPVILDHKPLPYFALKLAFGWNDFRKENALVIGKTYTFEFNPTKNVIEVKEQKNRGGDEAGVPQNFRVQVKIEDDQETGSNAARTWRFSKELKKNHFTTWRMGIPKDFALGTGIATNRKITLQDGRGRKWPVNVTDRNLGNYGMTAGWRNFLIGNEVGIGSMISFRFIQGSDNVVEALVIKNEHSTTEKSAKRRRPPIRHRS